MKIIEYDRAKAVAYAKEWAFKRNPEFYNFNNLGGDCTNFASQCIYAGTGIMNFTPTFGWYYRSLNDRAPAWTGVEYLYNFLVGNGGEGPFAENVPLEKVEIGDIIQLGTATGDFYHSPVVVDVRGGRIFIAAHSYDAYMRPLSTYNYYQARGIHILGARKAE